jgi:hypothetical protein
LKADAAFPSSCPALGSGFAGPSTSLVPGIHVFRAEKQDVDGRDKPGHDEP